MNSTTALCPPRFTLDDGGDYSASRPQRWIWRQWHSYWERVAEARRNRLIVIINGELADDNRHVTTQVVTRNPADMLRLSVAALRPMLDLAPDLLYVTRGTEAHSGTSAWLDEAIAHDIGATGESQDIASHWRLRVSIDGVKVDVAHHPPGGGGRTLWTRQNYYNRLAAQVFMAGAVGRDWPDLYIRSHIHAPGDSFAAYPVRALITPSWQLSTAYAHRIAGDPLPVGGLIIQCDRGYYELAAHYYTWPVAKYEAI